MNPVDIAIYAEAVTSVVMAGFTGFLAILTWKSGYLAMMLDSARLNPWRGTKRFHFAFAETTAIATDDTRLT